MSCQIIWNSLDLAAWETRYQSVRRSPLLQSYNYAKAACPLYGQKARWGLITIDGKEAGLCQILEAGIFANSLHAIILDRGPIWFEGFGSTDDHNKFFIALNQIFPRRLGRRRRIIPELIDSKESRLILKKTGFKRLPRPGYETIWLDLTLPLETLRASLDKKWRNALSKAERSPLSVRIGEDQNAIAILLSGYQASRTEKAYRGPSLKLVKSLLSVFLSAKKALILEALIDGQVEASILVLCHGRSATYQIGWTSDNGRGMNAHNLLLWQAMSVLKDMGIYDFDLGGINEADKGKGLRQFKTGMGGEIIRLAGHFC